MSPLLGQSESLAAPECVRMERAALIEINTELSYPDVTDRNPQASAQRGRASRGKFGSGIVLKHPIY